MVSIIEGFHCKSVKILLLVILLLENMVRIHLHSFCIYMNFEPSYLPIFYSPTLELEWYQSKECVTVRVKLKAKLDYPIHKIRYKFEEKYCAISIAGNTALSWCINVR